MPLEAPVITAMGRVFSVMVMRDGFTAWPNLRHDP
jgi:hypothetical protein